MLMFDINSTKRLRLKNILILKMLLSYIYIIKKIDMEQRLNIFFYTF